MFVKYFRKEPPTIAPRPMPNIVVVSQTPRYIGDALGETFSSMYAGPKR